MENNVMSSAAQVIIAIIPIVGIVMGAVVVFFSMLWRHLEIRKQIMAGTYRPERFNLKAYSLLIGLLLTGVGAILTVFFILMNGASPAILGGLIPLAIGICLIIFYKINDWN